MHAQAISKDILLFRFFNPGDSYFAGDPYTTLMVVQVYEPENALIIQALHGTATRTKWMKFKRWALDRGFTTLYYERRQKHGGIRSDGVELGGYWKGYYRTELKDD